MGLYLARHPYHSRALLHFGEILPAGAGMAQLVLPQGKRGKAIKQAEVVESVDTPS